MDVEKASISFDRLLPTESDRHAAAQSGPKNLLRLLLHVASRNSTSGPNQGPDCARTVTPLKWLESGYCIGASREKHQRKITYGS
jgi:hypothetical protein